MRYPAVLLVIAAALQGCASNPEGWNACVQRGLFTGDTFKNVENGKTGTIVRIGGPDAGCRDPRHPIAAEVAY